MTALSFKKLIRAGLALAALGLLLPIQGEDQEMLGSLTREEILTGHPDWQEMVAVYQPEPSAVERLRTLDAPVQVDVFLGTWCSDSKAHVSAFFKLLDAVDNPLLGASYVGVPRDKAKRADYYREQDIEKLPTFLVMVDGREKGRIIEVPVTSIEQDLVDILGR